MNNEDKILELLGQMAERQDRTEAMLGKMRQEMNERFDILESSMKFAWQDISLTEKRIKQHEKEFHSVG